MARTYRTPPPLHHPWRPLVVPPGRLAEQLQGNEPMNECRGFCWIGQPFTSCDNCGRPAWEHDGMDHPDGFLSTTSHIVPWTPGQAEAIRRRWEQAS